MKITKQTKLREVLQYVGTDLLRDQLHPDIHSMALFVDYKLENLVHGATTFKGQKIYEGVYPNWIISDLRFENEAQAIKDRNGLCIRVNRSLETQVVTDINNRLGTTVKEEHLVKETFDEMRKFEHPSETALDDYKDWDYIINNNGTIEELVEKVRIILQKEKII